MLQGHQQRSDYASTVRIMTWNIHSGIGSDGRRDLARVVDVIRSQQPDIVALQEVDSRRAARELRGAFEYLAEELGLHAASSRLITAPDGQYGHMLISRWPLFDTRYHNISVSKREPRAAIETMVTTPYGPVHLIATHLGLSLRERRHQAQRIAAAAGRGPRQTVVLGDFNDWTRRGSVQRCLASLMAARTHHKTFPAKLPLLALDRIYCRTADMLVHSRTVNDAWRASDHLPVIADISLRNRGPAYANQTFRAFS